MKLIIEKDYEAMSRLVAHMTLGKMISPYRRNISITAGETPRRVYEIMTAEVKDKAYLDNVYYYNFDEVPIKGKELGVTITDLKSMYFDPANIDDDHIIPLNEKNYQTHMEHIREAGGLDYMLMGLGSDGHYCGNLPGVTKFEDEIVAISSQAIPGLAELLIQYLDSPEQLCEYYVTMGPKAVMETRELVIMANGKRKAEAVKKLLTGPVTNNFPASILKLHPNVTLIIDEEAASLL